MNPSNYLYITTNHTFYQIGMEIFIDDMLVDKIPDIILYSNVLDFPITFTFTMIEKLIILHQFLDNQPKYILYDLFHSINNLIKKNCKKNTLGQEITEQYAKEISKNNFQKIYTIPFYYSFFKDMRRENNYNIFEMQLKFQKYNFITHDNDGEKILNFELDIKKDSSTFKFENNTIQLVFS